MNTAKTVNPVRDRWLLIALFVLAFCLRLGAIGVMTGLNTAPVPGSDDHEYATYARNIAEGRGYRGPSPDVRDPEHLTAYRPPTTPLYYAAVYRVFGFRPAAAHVANCLLAAITVLLVYGIALQCFGRGAARLASAAFAFYPIGIYFNLTLLSETLAAFLVSLFVWCCLRVKSAGLGWAAASGLALGALLLCKPAFLFVLPFLALWGVAVAGRDRPTWTRVGVLAASAGLVMAPWVVRNAVVMGSPIPFSTMGGSLLLQSNNRIVVEDPMLYGYSVWDSFIPEYAAALKAPDDEIQRDNVAKALALAWLRENPDKWFYLFQGKVLRLWTPLFHGGSNRVLSLAASVYYGLILLCFLAAIVPVSRRLVRERHPGAIMLGMIVSVFLTALIFQGQHRYRFPIDPLLMCIGASAVMGLGRVVASGSYAGVAASAAASLRRHRLAYGAALVLLGALLGVWKVDQARIEAYRDAQCRARLQGIHAAMKAYRAKHAALPASVADLVPGFLPNVGALHCPSHSLNWREYVDYGSTDPEQAAHVISYALHREQGGTQLLVADAEDRHSGLRNAIREDGALVRMPGLVLVVKRP
jgi:4-amino-4-deoxy-L-arabinose transferase-like glycosyltransferase